MMEGAEGTSMVQQDGTRTEQRSLPDYERSTMAAAAAAALTFPSTLKLDPDLLINKLGQVEDHLLLSLLLLSTT